MTHPEEGPSWEMELWRWLDGLPYDQRYVETSTLITYVTQELLTKLSDYRRVAAALAVDNSEGDTVAFAERVGGRPGAILRLVEEGRTQLRRQRGE